ncbi:MAG: thrombospondin type 3 repeat-containing protein [Patescibacteria group bacterium]
MAYSLRTTLIAGSLVVSLALVTTAFVISSKSAEVSAQNAEELLRAYATKDTDSDGLPDWQEQLYNTDPKNPSSVDPSMTDSEAVAAGLVKPKFESTDVSVAVPIDSVPGVQAAPETVTDRFARKFFEEYLLMRGPSGLTTDSLLSFINTKVAELAANNEIPKAYTNKDVRASTSGEVGLRAYATGADLALIASTNNATEDAMYYFGKVTYENDTTALTQLKAIGAAYEKVAESYIRIPAPPELALIHLRFANALALMGTVINDLVAVNEDPLRAFLVLGQYEYAAKEMADSILAFDAVYDAAKITETITVGEPGYEFYLLIHRAGIFSEQLKHDTP